MHPNGRAIQPILQHIIRMKLSDLEVIDGDTVGVFFSGGGDELLGFTGWADEGLAGRASPNNPKKGF